MNQSEIIDNQEKFPEVHLSSQRDNQFPYFKKNDALERIFKLEEYKDGVNLPSNVGKMVAATSSTSACTYESVRVSALMEEHMIGEMLELVGFKNGEGQMTTGLCNANMLAMMSARNEILPEVKSNGLLGEEDIYGFVSADAHYSMEQAVNILGLGINRLIEIPVGTKGEMDISILAKRLAQSVLSGGRPFFVGATAGTTIRGAYDSIAEILELRQQYKFWLHVDGAWGSVTQKSRWL